MTKKVLALSLAMFAALPIEAFAQDGLFQRGMTDEAYYDFGGSSDNCGLFGNRNATTMGTINNQTFGQPLPRGSGLVILLAAGAGYAAFKRKEEKK